MQLRTKLPRLLAGVLLGVSLGFPARAGGAELDFGVRAGGYLDRRDPFVGFELLIPLGSGEWYANPNVEAVFSDRRDRVALSCDFLFGIRETSDLFIYAGAGPSVWRLDADPPRNRSAETKGGVNLLGGVAWRMRELAPFAQLKIVLAEDSQVVAAVGLRF